MTHLRLVTDTELSADERFALEQAMSTVRFLTAVRPQEPRVVRRFERLSGRDAWKDDAA